MSDLAKAISDTVENQNEVSEFMNIAAGSTAAGVPETENQLSAAAPAVKPEKRGRGRPRKNKNKHTPKKSFIPSDELKHSVASDGLDNSALDAGKEALSRRNAAIGATAVVQTTGMMLAGQDGKMPQDEFSTMQENFEKYFEAKGISDFPPGIALGLTLSCYYTRILLTEKTRPKVALFFAWVKNKYYAFRKIKRPEPKEAEHAAE